MATVRQAHRIQQEKLKFSSIMARRGVVTLAELGIAPIQKNANQKQDESPVSMSGDNHHAIRVSPRRVESVTGRFGWRNSSPNQLST